MKTWFMIPVRGGSQGVPRKNIRKLGDKPLLAHTLDTLTSFVEKESIIVISDDEEILDFACSYEIKTIREEKTTGKATLDDVAMKVISAFDSQMKEDDFFITIQATCPFIKKETIEKALELLKNGASSVVTAIDDRHLNWGLDNNGEPTPKYEKRVNRQELPAHFKESGAVIGSKISLIKKNNTRINMPLKLIPIQKDEGLDIDDFNDWAIAEYIVNKKKIVIRTDAAINLGMGHVYRSLAVAQELSKHAITIITSKDAPLGHEFFSQYPFNLVQVSSEQEFFDYVRSNNVDLCIVDKLDTEKEYIKSIKDHGPKVITFEDMGTGADVADLLISDLYKNLNLAHDKQLAGVKNAILAPSFESYDHKRAKISKDVENLLVIFGGTDPSNLTELALKSLQEISFKGNVHVVQGLGKKDRKINLEGFGLTGEVLTNVTYMPKLMSQMDMAISSGGRTITELMSFGIPTVCLCQNEKELTHTHATQEFGVMNLGLGKLMEVSNLSKQLEFVFSSHELRLKMHERALHEIKGRSNKKIIEKAMQHLDLDI